MESIDEICLDSLMYIAILDLNLDTLDLNLDTRLKIESRFRSR